MFEVLLFENFVLKKRLCKTKFFETACNVFNASETIYFPKKFRNNRKKIEKVEYSIRLTTDLDTYELNGQYNKLIEVEEKFYCYSIKKHLKYDYYINKFLIKKRNLDFYYYKNKLIIVRNNKIFDVLNFLTPSCSRRFYKLLPKQTTWMFFDELFEYSILKKTIEFCKISPKNFYRKTNR